MSLRPCFKWRCLSYTNMQPDAAPVRTRSRTSIAKPYFLLERESQYELTLQSSHATKRAGRVRELCYSRDPDGRKFGDQYRVTSTRRVKLSSRVTCSIREPSSLH